MTVTTDQAQEVAATIRSQIDRGVLMSLGAHHFAYGTDQMGQVSFLARILPFTKLGHRSARVANMVVTITLNGLDYYDITVKHWANYELTIHAEGHDIDAFTLNRWLLALDYDGDTALNPRYI